MKHTDRFTLTYRRADEDGNDIKDISVSWEVPSDCDNAICRIKSNMNAFIKAADLDDFHFTKREPLILGTLGDSNVEAMVESTGAKRRKI